MNKEQWDALGIVLTVMLGLQILTLAAAVALIVRLW